MESVNYAALAAAAALAYVIGSISFSTIFARKFRHEDIRAKGSGNAGTANMLRSYGWKLGVATLVCDVLKGTASALIGMWLAGPAGMYVGAVFSVVGHCFSCFMRFRGGKGIATGIGAFLVIQPIATVIICAVCVAVVVMTRIMSVGSMLGCVLSAVAALFLSAGDLWAAWWNTAAILIAALCIWSHRSNIQRLMRGEENKLSFGRK